jgi:N utilization substance protein A
MDKSFLEAIRDIQQEKKLSEEVVVGALKEALIKSFRREFNIPEEYDLKVEIDLGEFEMEVLSEKEVVRKPFVDAIQVDMDEALEHVDEADYGDRIYISLDSDNLSRTAMQMIKNVFQQKIQEGEQRQHFEKYKDRMLELVNGVVQQVKEKTVYVQLDDKVEAILPYREQIGSDDYRTGNRMKFLIVKVSLRNDGLLVVVSRTHPGLINRLFQLHIPEVHDDLIEIVDVAREAGSRSKVAVKSHDPTLDPIGTCVGPRGSRIQSIVQEVNGEKIDIIPYEEDIQRYIENSLSPARISRVNLIEEDEEEEKEKVAQVVVPEDQLSLAIGKGGQNARLTAKLCGWSIDIYSEQEFASMGSEGALEVAASIFKDSPDEEEDFLMDLEGVGPGTADNLREAGYDTALSIVEAGVEGLQEVSGVGPATAASIHEQVSEIVRSAARGKSVKKERETREETAEKIKQTIFGESPSEETE